MRVAVVMLIVASAWGQEPTTRGRLNESLREKANMALASGIADLRAQQHRDGYWPLYDRGQPIPILDGSRVLARTGAVVYTLVAAGVDPEDGAIRRALTWAKPRLDDISPRDCAYWILALSRAAPVAEKIRIRKLVIRLLENAKVHGWWEEGVSSAPGVHGTRAASVLALWEAATRARDPVPRDVWIRIRDYWRATQRANGSWIVGTHTNWRVHQTAVSALELALATAALEGGRAVWDRTRADERIARALRVLKSDWTKFLNRGSGLSFSPIEARVAWMREVLDPRWYPTCVRWVLSGLKAKHAWRHTYGWAMDQSLWGLLILSGSHPGEFGPAPARVTTPYAK